MEREKPDYEIMYDGVPEQEEDKLYMPGYTPKELDRLMRFMHIHEQVVKIEDLLAENKNIGWYMKVNEGKGNPKDLVFEMNSGLLYRMKMVAFHMYKGHDVEIDGRKVHIPGFIDEPHMREAADMMLTSAKQDRETARDFEINELNDLWGRE